jgi:hypothetical protein
VTLLATAAWVTASGTVSTGLVSRAAVRPRFSPSTASKAWYVADGTSFFFSAHRKIRLMRLTLPLIVFLANFSSIIACCTASNSVGPKSSAGVRPYSRLRVEEALLRLLTSAAG